MDLPPTRRSSQFLGRKAQKRLLSKVAARFRGAENEQNQSNALSDRSMASSQLAIDLTCKIGSFAGSWAANLQLPERELSTRV